MAECRIERVVSRQLPCCFHVAFCGVHVLTVFTVSYYVCAAQVVRFYWMAACFEVPSRPRDFRPMGTVCPVGATVVPRTADNGRTVNGMALVR